MSVAGKAKPTASTSAVKAEKRPAAAAEEGEYDEWARGLVNRPIPQVGTNLTLSGVLASSTTIDGSIHPNNGYDLDSAIGRFTWYTVSNTEKSVPCVFRDGEPYCCLRILEIAVICELLYMLPQDVYDAAPVKSHSVSCTPAEAKLLGHINSWHCDSQYGTDPFTTSEYLMTIPVLEQFYKYLKFAYEVLSSGGGNKSEDYVNCGFVRVNNESLIPYTVLTETEKGIPLFYFEGQTDILKVKAGPLEGWPLAYLKICCRVQGVRKDLISSESLLIIKLTDLKGYFPKRTVFTDKCWPAPKSKSLITKQMLSSRSMYANPLKFHSSQATNPTTPQNNTHAGPWLSLSENSNVLRVGNGVTGRVNTLSSSTNSTGSVLSSHARNISTFNNYSAGGQAQTSTYTNGYQVPQVQHQRNGQVTVSNVSLQPQRNQVLAGKTMNLSKLKVNTPPVSFTGLNVLPEYSDGHKDGAYIIRMLLVDNDLIHCINTKPFKQDAQGQFLILQEFVTKFFPGVSIYPTVVSVLKSLGITTYLPNDGIIRVLNNSGFSISRQWEAPLIEAKFAVQQLGRLKQLLTPKPTAPRLNPSSDITNNANRVRREPVDCIELD